MARPWSSTVTRLWLFWYALRLSYPLLCGALGQPLAGVDTLAPDVLPSGQLANNGAFMMTQPAVLVTAVHEGRTNYCSYLHCECDTAQNQLPL